MSQNSNTNDEVKERWKTHLSFKFRAPGKKYTANVSEPKPFFDLPTTPHLLEEDVQRALEKARENKVLADDDLFALIAAELAPYLPLKVIYLPLAGHGLGCTLIEDDVGALVGRARAIIPSKQVFASGSNKQFHAHKISWIIEWELWEAPGKPGQAPHPVYLQEGTQGQFAFYCAKVCDHHLGLKLSKTHRPNGWKQIGIHCHFTPSFNTGAMNVRLSQLLPPEVANLEPTAVSAWLRVMRAPMPPRLPFALRLVGTKIWGQLALSNSSRFCVPFYHAGVFVLRAAKAHKERNYMGCFFQFPRRFPRVDLFPVEELKEKPEPIEVMDVEKTAPPLLIENMTEQPAASSTVDPLAAPDCKNNPPCFGFCTCQLPAPLSPLAAVPSREELEKAVIENLEHHESCTEQDERLSVVASTGSFMDAEVDMSPLRMPSPAVLPTPPPSPGLVREISVPILPEEDHEAIRQRDKAAFHTALEVMQGTVVTTLNPTPRPIEQKNWVVERRYEIGQRLQDDMQNHAAAARRLAESLSKEDGKV